MNYLLALIARHGYLLVTGIVFAEAVGLPCPAALALVAGGAAVASGILSPVVWLLALCAMLLGDSVLYLLGRSMGWALLGLLCKVSANPETCILRSAESFYKRGKITLVLAKFIPGVNTMAPPLAGSMKMRPQQFLRLDLAGATLYTSAYFGLGYVFRDFLAAITRGFQTAGRVFEEVLLVVLIAYIVYRVWLYRKHAIYRVVPRVQVEELAHKLASEGRGKMLLVDVRSHGYYDAGSARIKGSIRIEPNNLAEELKTLPKDKDIYLYCT
ncbi:MAG: VTT domain-containing protein [Acidobacteriia bacterium]|nr:VTT domain-containing protein [Terriglobia bacterium]